MPFPWGLIMALNQEQKKQFKSIGHHLKPVLIVGENGLTEGVMAELDRALKDHELIKVKFSLNDRDERRELMDELCNAAKCELIQTIGKMALIYRKAQPQNRSLSNVVRHSL
jgi:RNA-binding protein